MHFPRLGTVITTGFVWYGLYKGFDLTREFIPSLKLDSQFFFQDALTTALKCGGAGAGMAVGGLVGYVISGLFDARFRGSSEKESLSDRV